jgi:hypothetical protein
MNNLVQKILERKGLLIALFVLLLAVLTMFLFITNDKTPEQIFASRYDGDWHKAIEDLGAIEAHRLFVEINDKLGVETQHGLAHVFGSALYDVEGVEGTTVCNSDYGFGCYHEFFLSAVTSEGLEVLNDLDQACIDKNGFGGQGCQHGIGHGLVQFFGHLKLNEALNKCAMLQWQESLFGCQSGVFMEYNFPTPIEGVTDIDVGREFDVNNIYAPCNTVPERFKYSCIYALPMWWAMLVEIEYPKIGSFCEELTEQKYSDICYKGLALTLIQTRGFDPVLAIETCEVMPSKRGEIMCKAGASWALWDSESSQYYKQPCESLSGTEYDLCGEAADPLGTHNLLTENSYPPEQ